MQISIIIPAYNSASYLHRCVDSIAKQDLPYGSYEAIVINDGSTDDSVDVLEFLCKEYSFLRYVTTDNKGLSLARNRGITESSGEFLLFLDSDDSLSANVLKTIYDEMALHRLDMMLLNYLYLSSNGTSLDIPFQMDANTRTVVSGKEFLLNDHYPPMVWAYAYKRTFLVENNLEMIPIWHEDEEFTPRAICLASRIKYYPLLFYCYYQNTDSFMVNYKESDMLYMLEAMSSLSLFQKKYTQDSAVRKYFDNRIATTVMLLFKNSIRSGYHNQKAMIESVKQKRILPLRPRGLHYYFWLFNISPSLFEIYYRLIKKTPKQFNKLGKDQK